MKNASICITVTIFQIVYGAVVLSPPWANPSLNPCAHLPGGWQLVYWAPLNQCFKIFQMGYPCPDSFELAPVGSVFSGKGSTAECRCPPGTAQSPLTNFCHKLFDRGPCDKGQYFSPSPEPPAKSAIPKQRWGSCKNLESCGEGMVYYPQKAKCYKLYTKGPCHLGKLLTTDENELPKCLCEPRGALEDFYHEESKTCHEFFTRGPCQRSGDLFLPSKMCGCNSMLPHYYNQTHSCYELKTTGPCAPGHEFVINSLIDNQVKAECRCKDKYSKYVDGYCYRTFTVGPCDDGHFLVDTNICMKNPCNKGFLYFPNQQTCYRIGSPGPCSTNQVVVFDFTTRPSIEGISFNGVCGCSGIINNLDQSCLEDDGDVKNLNPCDSTTGMIEINGECYKLYSQGPCQPGQWLEPKRPPGKFKSAKCQCKPGYTPYDDKQTTMGVSGCLAPSVGIARYLNGKNYKNYTFGFQRF